MLFGIEGCISTCFILNLFELQELFASLVRACGVLGIFQEGASAAEAAPAEQATAAPQAKVEKELSGWAAWRATVGGPRRSAAAEEARNAEKHRKLEEQLWQ